MFSEMFILENILLCDYSDETEVSPTDLKI